jgi:hypothetical protein
MRRSSTTGSRAPARVPGSEYRYGRQRALLRQRALSIASRRSSRAFTQFATRRRSTRRRSTTMQSAVTQQVGPDMRAQVNIDYFSDVFLQQLYNRTSFYRRHRRSGDLRRVDGARPRSAHDRRLLTRGARSSAPRRRRAFYGQTPRLTASMARSGCSARRSTLGHQRLQLSAEPDDHRRRPPRADTTHRAVDVAPSVRARACRS